MATIQFGAITTTTATADQEILTFTPSAATSWKSTLVASYLTTYSATEAVLGTVTLQRGGPTDIGHARLQSSDLENTPGVFVIPWGTTGITFTGTEVVRWITTPAITTSIRWTASLFGQG